MADVDSLFTNFPLEETIVLIHFLKIWKKQVYQKQSLRNFYLFIQKNLIFKESSTSKLMQMELLWVHTFRSNVGYLMLFQYILKIIDYKIVHLTLSLITASGMLRYLCFIQSLTKTFRSPLKFSKWSTCYQVILSRCTNYS